MSREKREKRRIERCEKEDREMKIENEVERTEKGEPAPTRSTAPLLSSSDINFTVEVDERTRENDLK